MSPYSFSGFDVEKLKIKTLHTQDLHVGLLWQLIAKSLSCRYINSTIILVRPETKIPWHEAAVLDAEKSKDRSEQIIIFDQTTVIELFKLQR